MRTHAADEMLKSGEIFEITPPPDSGARVFLARGFTQGCLQVAELDGENRDSRLVAPRDLPLPGEFLKWPLKIEVDGRRDDYARDVLAVLRGNLTDLRFAVEQGMNIFFDGVHPGDRPPFSAYTNLPDTFLFRRAVYGFGGQAIRPRLDAVDVDQLGVIPPEWIHRSTDGSMRSWDAQVREMSVKEGHLPRIAEAASRAGLLVYPDVFLGANIFPESQRDRALSTMNGYLPEDPRFESLEEAHAIVQALVSKALEGRA